MSLELKTGKHDLSELEGLYLDGDTCDQEIFAEMRSNLLLVSGEHYNRRQALFYRRIRDSREMTQEQKLRITKNHIQKICKIYGNNIVSMNPGVGFEPKDENDLQDQKSAELHHSVWQDACQKYRIETEKVDDWCDDFIQLGEVAVKIFFDPGMGEVKGYEHKQDEEGNPLFTNTQGEETTLSQDTSTMIPHEPVGDDALPVFTGDFVFEEIYGFNLLRSPQAKAMSESPWLCIRKMCDKDVIAKQFPDSADKLSSTSEDTYIVFDQTRGGYKKTAGQVMLREFYFRPSAQYPRGYFYFTTKEVILAEGELPGGVFPIIYAPFDKIQTTPRGRSPIKHMRPYQVEINRAASKIAEHQITLGDDKLMFMDGSKVTQGASLPGVRTINYTGMAPEVLPGRSGEQYLAYMNAQIVELYDVMNVAEDSVTQDQQVEPYALLFRSASQKKKFQRYIKRFEAFLVEVCSVYLKLAKVHLPDDAIVYAVGKRERVNIPEFKNAQDLCYTIKIEAQADDIETKFGKQLTLNHILQYVGPQLKPEDIAKILKQMPYANVDGSFDDMTLDYDLATNDILALDRGDQPPINQYDNHVYSIKRLVSRTRQADFKYLQPQVQQSYMAKIQMHEQLEAQRQVTLQRAEQGYIPTGGYMVKCDFYVTDPSNPNGTRRASFPYEAMSWLAKQLESQGQSLEQLETMNAGAGQQIAGMMTSMGPGAGVMPQPHAASTVVPPKTPPHPPGQPPALQRPMPPNGMGGPGPMGAAMPGGPAR